MKLAHLACLMVVGLSARAAPSSTNALDQAQLAYNLKTTVGEYENLGRKSPKWDAEAERSLVLFARIRSSTNGVPPDLGRELRASLERATAAGCDDPLIRYLHLRFVDSRTGPSYATAFREAASAVEQSDYSPIRKFYAVAWARNSLASVNSGGPELPVLLTNAASYLAKALDEAAMAPREADQACDFLMSAPWPFERGRWDCHQILEAALDHRWRGSSIALLAKGQAYLSYAWAARGTGWANTVTEASFKLMAERLSVAAAALEEAWRLDPHDPRICLEMMRVELGQGEGRDRLELWFQRGMKLDPASYDLCRAKIEYLRPRWYGSVKEMIDFGRECMTNTSWSGGVRLMLVDAHDEATREIQDNAERAAYWSRAAVWTDIKDTYERYFRLYPDAVGYRHNYARYAARCGQWQEVLDQVKMFETTNYAFFGGVEQFNRMVKTAEQHVHAQ